MNGIPTPKAKIRDNLVVPASSSMQLLRRLTNKVRKCCFDVHVNIFPISSPNKSAVLNPSLYLIKPTQYGISVTLAHQSLHCNKKLTIFNQKREKSNKPIACLVSEHCGVGTATGDVLFVKNFVERNRLTKLLDAISDALLETATP